MQMPVDINLRPAAPSELGRATSESPRPAAPHRGPAKQTTGSSAAAVPGGYAGSPGPRSETTGHGNREPGNADGEDDDGLRLAGDCAVLARWRTLSIPV